MAIHAHASPGVYFETLDYSSYISTTQSTILALIGSTRKGPSEPTYISTARQFTDTYGLPRKGDYSSLAALSYLEYGSSLWFRRLVGKDATKATAGIPTADNKSISPIVVGDDNKYIYTINLTDENGSVIKPIPGSINVSVVDPTGSISDINFTDEKVDSLRGAFDTYNYQGITDYANYIDYNTGDFRFTTKSLVPDSKVVVLKYVRNSTEVSKSSYTSDVTVSTSTYSGTITFKGQSFKSSINPNNFLLTAVTNDNSYYITVKKDSTKSGSSADLQCIDVNGNTVALTNATIDLVTGEWTLTTESVLVSPVWSLTYKYDNFKWFVCGESTTNDQLQNFVDSLNIPVNSASLGIFVVDKANDYTTSIANIYTAKAIDNGNGVFVENTDTVFLENGITIGTSNYINSVDYTNGKINFVLTTLPQTGFEINVKCMSKTNKVLGEVKTDNGLANPVIVSSILNSAVIPGEVSITVGDKQYLDDGKGNIVNIDSTSTDTSFGTIEYRIRNTVSGKMTSELEFKFTGTVTQSTNIVVTYTKEMGKVTAYSYGEAFNNTIVQFLQEDFKNGATTSTYAYKLWLSDTLSGSTADEYKRSFTFGDSSATTYFLNKVTSSYVEFELYEPESDLIPVVGNYISLTGGDDDEADINENSAVLAIDDFNTPETYDISVMTCPDFAGSKVVSLKLIDLCENQRGDCFALIDPPQGLTPQNVVAWHNGDGKYSAENALNSNMAALYYPWIQINNQFTEAYEWVPPSVKMVSVYAYSDSNSEVWFAPAGLNRGRILNALKLERVLTLNERDLLYATGNNCVNPICDFVGSGIVVWGQKTLQRTPSALDRVNVSRLLIYIAKVLANSTKGLLFDPHDEITWVLYKQMVNPYMEKIKSGRGVYEYLVQCDKGTNTDSDIDNNTMVAEIWIKPTKTAERIITKFYITSTGATLGSITTTTA